MQVLLHYANPNLSTCEHKYLLFEWCKNKEMSLMHAFVCFLPVLHHLQLLSMKALLFTAYLGCGTVLCVLLLHI